MHDPEQKENIKRVSAAIAKAVKEFCADVLARRNPATFHMATLVDRVGLFRLVAPDSPGRILRDLRKRGELDYTVVNRAQSLYLVNSVKP